MVVTTEGYLRLEIDSWSRLAIVANSKVLVKLSSERQSNEPYISRLDRHMRIAL